MRKEDKGKFFRAILFVTSLLFVLFDLRLFVPDAIMALSDFGNPVWFWFAIFLAALTAYSYQKKAEGKAIVSQGDKKRLFHFLYIIFLSLNFFMLFLFMFLICFVE